MFCPNDSNIENSVINIVKISFFMSDTFLLRDTFNVYAITLSRNNDFIRLVNIFALWLIKKQLHSELFLFEDRLFVSVKFCVGACGFDFYSVGVFECFATIKVFDKLAFAWKFKFYFLGFTLFSGVYM